MVGTLTEKNNGNRYMLVIYNLFSTWAEAYPLKSTDSETIASILINDIIYRFGIPKQIHSDNGTNFTSELIKNVCDTFGIIRTNTSTYHPEGNGGVECMNGALKSMLMKACDKYIEWDLELPKILFYYRNSTHLNGIFPFQACHWKILKTIIGFNVGYN